MGLNVEIMGNNGGCDFSSKLNEDVMVISWETNIGFEWDGSINLNGAERVFRVKLITIQCGDPMLDK